MGTFDAAVTSCEVGPFDAAVTSCEVGTFDATHVRQYLVPGRGHERKQMFDRAHTLMKKRDGAQCMMYMDAAGWTTTILIAM